MYMHAHTYTCIQEDRHAFPNLYITHYTINEIQNKHLFTYLQATYKQSRNYTRDTLEGGSTSIILSI